MSHFVMKYIIIMYHDNPSLLQGFYTDWKLFDVQDIEHKQVHNQKKGGQVYIHFNDM